MDVIALSTGEVLFEYQDNSVSDFLAHSSRASSSPEMPRRRPRSYIRNGSYTGSLVIVGVLKL